MISHAPPVSSLFAAFLGYNPIEKLAGPHVLHGISAHAQAVVTGRAFLPALISEPFRSGLHATFAFAITACLIAAVASLLRGGKYHHEDAPRVAESGCESLPAPAPVAWPGRKGEPGGSRGSAARVGCF